MLHSFLWLSAHKNSVPVTGPTGLTTEPPSSHINLCPAHILHISVCRLPLSVMWPFQVFHKVRPITSQPVGTKDSLLCSCSSGSFEARLPLHAGRLHTHSSRQEFFHHVWTSVWFCNRAFCIVLLFTLRWPVSQNSDCGTWQNRQLFIVLDGWWRKGRDGITKGAEKGRRTEKQYGMFKC